MAASTPEPEDLVSCANCLETEGYLRNPLLLPCGHVFCEGCLRKLQRDANVLICFSCKADTRTAVDQLPSALVGPETYCKPCKSKGETKMTARVYCAQCNNKFCAKHEQIHKELNDAHRLLGIKAYKKSTYAEELRFCDEHRAEPYSIGCNKCWIVICPLCITSTGDCTDGPCHSFMSLLELSEFLTEALEPIKQKAEERFDKLSALMKETTLFVSQWDSETQEAVEGLNRTRKEQIEAINAKYDEMVSEYCESREKTKTEITGYIESNGGLQLTQLHERLKALQTDVSTKHLVDLVKGKRDLEKAMEEISDAEFARVVIKGQKNIAKKEQECREIEMVLQSADDITIGPDDITIGSEDITKSKPKPTSLTLIREVKVSGNPTAVCQYKGLTYVGKNQGKVDMIDAEGKVTPDVITIGRYITGIVSKDDRVYILAGGSGNNYTIYVHDLTGRQLHSWIHGDTGNYSARALAIISDQLVVADRTSKTLTVYTLTGQQVRTIPCDRINNNYLSVCCLSDNSMIIANSGAKSELYKVGMTDGKTEWTVESLDSGVSNVGGLTRYSEDYVLVTNISSTQVQVWILEGKTGAVMGSLKENKTRNSSHNFDLIVDGDTLIVARYSEEAVLFYEIK